MPDSDQEIVQATTECTADDMIEKGILESIGECKNECTGSTVGFAVEEMCRNDSGIFGEQCICLQKICSPSNNTSYRVFKYVCKFYFRFMIV